jgi:hypothetical protein
MKGPELLLHPGPFSNQRPVLRAVSSPLVRGGSALVDLIVAVGRGRRTHIDLSPAVLKVKVVSIPSNLDDAC